MILESLFKKNEEITPEFCSKLNPDKYPEYLMKIFKQKNGYIFDLNNPKNLNEIIQYLKLYDNTPIKAVLTDKTLVNDFVAGRLGTNKYRKEIFGIFDSITDVDFTTLPDKFIIKKNNSCFFNFPILDKSKLSEKHIQSINNYFEHNKNLSYSFVNGFEMQYKDIPNKIIIERLYPKIQEYQILCTFGKPLFICRRDDKNYVYSEITSMKEYVESEIPNKVKIKEIIDAAEVLSKDFKLVRVDFMLVNDTWLFFQELTFTPYSGYTDLPEYNSSDIGALVKFR